MQSSTTSSKSQKPTTCPGCGNPIRENWQLCPSCGFDLTPSTAGKDVIDGKENNYKTHNIKSTPPRKRPRGTDLKPDSLTKTTNPFRLGLFLAFGSVALLGVIMYMTLGAPAKPDVGQIFLQLTNTPVATKTVVTNTPRPTQTKAPTKIPTITPTPVGGGHGKIIFLSGVYEKDQWNVYSINSKGTGLQQLTSKDTTIYHPVWSPDGSKIALAIKENGFFQLYIMNADGKELTRLSADDKKNYNHPSWSPDGERIVYSSAANGAADDVYVMNTDGTGVTRLTNSPRSDYSPVWSVDGQKIAFISDRSGFSEVYIMNADGTKQTRLTNFKANTLDPAWSPNGNYIVFASSKDQQYYEIYMMNSDGSNVIRLTNNDTWDLRPRFTPDGKKISWDSCCFNISIMNLDGTGVTKIYSDFEWDADWEP